MHRQARAAYSRGDRNTLDAQTLFAALEARAPATAEYTQRLLTSTAAIDLAECLGRAGYTLKLTPYTRAARGYLDTTVLRVRARSSYTTEIFSTLPGGPLQAGDLILAVGQTPVERMVDVELALARLGSSSRVSLRVQRGAKTITVPIGPLPPTGPTTPSTHVRLTPKKGARPASPFAAP